jgi:lipid-A-disaccharide synthase-like uncharacterized protein
MNMIEQWREVLYPLGFLSSLAFTARFLVQWIYSEIKQQSLVTQLFWKLSLTGNFFLMIHSIIQGQFHVAFIQTCNGVISWRNLNLMQPSSQQCRWQVTLIIMGIALSFLVLVFSLQAFWLSDGIEGWFRVPVWIGQEADHAQVELAWHLLGFGGLVLFNSRFWIQWWIAEKHKTSVLSPSFWWMSLIGDIFCLSYFLRMGDLVNIVGPAFGLIPYLRNLMLIYKPSKASKSTS